MTTSQKIVGIIGVIAVAALMYGSYNCGQRSITKHTGIDTVLIETIDTIETKPDPVTIIPDTVYKYIKGRTLHDTLEIDNTVKLPITDTLKELERLWSIEADYNGYVVYKDSAKGLSWLVSITDTVHENRLQGRTWIVKNTDTTIKSVTILKPPRNIVGYFTLAGMANIPKNTYGGGLGFALKTPKDNVYQIELTKIVNTPMLYGGRIFLPIRLRKK